MPMKVEFNSENAFPLKGLWRSQIGTHGKSSLLGLSNQYKKRFRIGNFLLKSSVEAAL